MASETAQSATSAREDEVRRLQEEMERELQAQQLGACVYEAGGKACCSLMTESLCNLLGGAWFAGQPCPERTPVDDAIDALQRKLDTQRPKAAETGTCVYVAGTRVCERELAADQCELIGGTWFAHEPPQDEEAP